MIPMGSLASHYPSLSSLPSDPAKHPSKAAPPQPSSHGSALRKKKTGRFLGRSARDLQISNPIPQRNSDDFPVLGEPVTTLPGRNPYTRGGTPPGFIYRRDSSGSSLVEIGSSIGLQSLSLRGPAPRKPKTTKLAPPTQPADARTSRPSTATGNYRAANPPPSGLVFQRIQDLATKRISTLDYLKKAHEGRTYWFNTVYFNRSDLQMLPHFEAQKLIRRGINLFYLGSSIPAVLDPNADNLIEYLRTFNALLAEFEAYQALHPPDGSASSTMSRVRMPHMFKRVTSGGPQGKGRRPSDFNPLMHPSESSDNLAQAGSSHGAAYSELGANQDYAYLTTPSLPLDPDYFETFATLCDVLIDCYTTILGLTANTEAVGPPATAELFSKTDLKVKKIIVTNIVRDFEQASRVGVRREIAGVGKVVLGQLM